MLDERRKKRITGSLIGAVLGLNPYKSRTQAMREMVLDALGKRAEFSNQDTERGKNLEIDGFNFIASQFVGTKPAGFKIHPEFDFLGATPDGVNYERGFVVEIKAPRFMAKSPHPHYMAQMQLQMSVFDLPECYFVQVCKGEIEGELIKRENDFVYKNLQTLQDFMRDFEFSLKNANNFLLDMFAKDLAKNKAAQKELQAQEELIKKAILTELDGKSYTSEHLTVSEVETVRNDYAAWLAQTGLKVPLDFQKRSISWRISPKPKKSEKSTETA